MLSNATGLGEIMCISSCVNCVYFRNIIRPRCSESKKVISQLKAERSKDVLYDLSFETAVHSALRACYRNQILEPDVGPIHGLNCREWGLDRSCYRGFFVIAILREDYQRSRTTSISVGEARGLSLLFILFLRTIWYLGEN